MDSAQILSVLTAVAAAIWSVLTWNENQKEQRQIKRDQEAALFVNAFILATEELQSRLYSILEEDDLAYYKKEYPGEYEFGSPAAVEVLYRLSQFFGWAHRTYRYGPYTNDPRIIELNRLIGETLENRSDFKGEAFRFSIDERVSLGEVVVRRVGEVTAVMPVFESIPLYQFQEELLNPEGKHTPLFQSKPVRATLAAIDGADNADELEGRERLAVLQNLLADLLAYMETMEGFSVSIGKIRKAGLPAACAFSIPVQANNARIIHNTRGRIRLGIERLKKDTAYAERLQSLLESVENVRNVRINQGAASVIVNYNPDIPAENITGTLLKAISGFS